MQDRLKQAQRQAAEQMLPYRATVQQVKGLESRIKAIADEMRELDTRIKFEEIQLPPADGKNESERKAARDKMIAESTTIQELRKIRYAKDKDLDALKVELNAALRTHSLDKKEVDLLIGLLEATERGELVTERVIEVPIADSAEIPLDILD